jgi:hypothetical protein
MHQTLFSNKKGSMTATQLIKNLIAYANELVDMGADREARAIATFLNKVKKQL